MAQNRLYMKNDRLRISYWKKI